jgi:hypothetical protein
MAAAGPAASTAAAAAAAEADSDDEDGPAAGAPGLTRGSLPPDTPAGVGARASVALATAWDASLHQPVLSRLGDDSDRVREGAAVLLGLFLGLDGAVFDLSETLPFLMPALLERCCGSLGYDPQEHVFIEDMSGESRPAGLVQAGRC